MSCFGSHFRSLLGFLGPRVGIASIERKFPFQFHLRRLWAMLLVVVIEVKRTCPFQDSEPRSAARRGLPKSSSVCRINTHGSLDMLHWLCLHSQPSGHCGNRIDRSHLIIDHLTLDEHGSGRRNIARRLRCRGLQLRLPTPPEAHSGTGCDFLHALSCLRVTRRSSIVGRIVHWNRLFRGLSAVGHLLDCKRRFRGAGNFRNNQRRLLRTTGC
mmetsp:Transcript_18056/g.48535  ORF Transcript_18056/g.48535 Transcript_18056/m.48535 type:complete len:213 (-) Transcript_18056:95-733(-)